MLVRLIGTLSSGFGSGQALRQRRPSNVANGIRTPSRRSTPMRKVSGESAAAIVTAAATTAAQRTAVLRIAGAGVYSAEGRRARHVHAHGQRSSRDRGA